MRESAASVPSFMKRRIPELLILAGASLFMFCLWYSAHLDPSIRWLHFFQAWMYVATVVLAIRRNRWGYFIGIATAGFWDYLNVFVTTFLRSGLHWLSVSMQSGHVRHPDQIIAVVAWIGNLLIVIGGIWGYARLPKKTPSDVVRVAGAFAGMLGFFALIIAACQPRYLGLFRAMLHPHRPW
jgi:hypothetical protein